VLVDAGSHVTPVQAAAVEAADEVVVVTTPDVLALRTLRRTLQTWEDLGVRKPESARVLLNQVSRSDEVQPETVRRLAQAPVVSVALPAMFRKLEQAVNNRDPLLVKEPAWWQAVRAAGREIGWSGCPSGRTWPRSSSDPPGAAGALAGAAAAVAGPGTAPSTSRPAATGGPSRSRRWGSCPPHARGGAAVAAGAGRRDLRLDRSCGVHGGAGRVGG
jgi:pilus assembly protein CpaE